MVLTLILLGEDFTFVGGVALLIQADSQCFHPECALCSRCGNPFEEDDSMCILGTYLRMYVCAVEFH